MIPKVIHYCWFGKGEKNDLILKCIQTWKDKLSDYEIKEWNEDNFDVNAYEFTRSAYTNKKWAFVADYARFIVLQKYGGIYLDTDMYVVRSFNDLLGQKMIIGYEDKAHVSAGIIGCTANNEYISDCLNVYNKMTTLTPIPKILTEVYGQKDYGFTPMPVNYFYPFTAENIKDFTGYNAPEETYAVHMWNYSWGHPLNKLAKKLGLHRLIVKILDTFKAKTILKKLLGME